MNDCHRFTALFAFWPVGIREFRNELELVQHPFALALPDHQERAVAPGLFEPCPRDDAGFTVSAVQAKVTAPVDGVHAN